MSAVAATDSRQRTARRMDLWNAILLLRLRLWGGCKLLLFQLCAKIGIIFGNDGGILTYFHENRGGLRLCDAQPFDLYLNNSKSTMMCGALARTDDSLGSAACLSKNGDGC